MNASNAFRSHLMQQFATAARGQSRPPLAMMSWMNDDANEKKKKKHAIRAREAHRLSSGVADDARSFSTSAAITNQNHKASSSRRLSSAAWSLSTITSETSVVESSPGSKTSDSVAKRCHPSQQGTQSGASASFSSSTLFEEDGQSGHDDNNPLTPDTAAGTVVSKSPSKSQASHGLSSTDDDRPRLASQFQTMIQTRRTTSHFAPLSASTSSPHWQDPSRSDEQSESLLASSEAFWKEALDRAVACGRRAPNHKRTEPFSFKRIVAPSRATERLAEIAYHVTLHKSQSEVHAEKKRVKWSSIPAFLVATLDHNSAQIAEQQRDDDGGDLYEPLPFVPIQTEREMEDYASTCAAVQNVLLSLHSENLASKWATGPVIHTRAFRELVGATHPCDRIVALIMVGLPQQPIRMGDNDGRSSFTNAPRQRRFRRVWNEYLQDLE